jgi:glutamyl/glutaminyl-tRNA synthetase
VRRCRPLIIQKYPAAQTMSDNKLITLLEIIKLEMATLNDSVALLEFYFVAPTVHKADIDACISGDSQIIIKEIIQSSYHLFTHSQEWILYIKSAVREKQLSVKEMFWFLRLALMGRIHGPSIPELLEMLGAECAQKRIEHVLHLL